MSFVTSLLLLLSLTVAVLVPLFVGHGLVGHGAESWIWIGVGALAVAAVLITVTLRMIKDGPGSRAH